ncbi:EAL domain-containing protein [Vreelandella utahensis]|uniref:EAL domain-containing protein n=1 Tax=Vreelandella halophila TaxID=86177 RepID=UPI0015C34140|nr:EAL domain-containing protein [Halomonas utahensis]
MAAATLIQHAEYSPSLPQHTTTDQHTDSFALSHRTGSIAELHQKGLLRSDNGWRATSPSHAAVGFASQPITFRLKLSNTSRRPLQLWVSVPAPYIDRIRAARLNATTEPLLPMRTQGSLWPFSSRLISLPSFHWPVIIPANDTITLFFEVSDAGPTVFPVSVQGDDDLVHSSVTRATVNGTLLGLSLFLLAINLFLTLRFRTLMLAWLTVLTVSVMHIQLVLNGFGAWIFWRGVPALDAVITTSMLTTLIAFAQHTLAALQPPRLYRHLLNGLSLAALMLILLEFARAELPIQALTIVLGIAGCGLSLVIAVSCFRHSLYARYFTAAVLILTAGIIVSTLRTVGVVPVNVLSDSAFSLGTILSAVVLLAAAVHFFWREQWLRRVAASDRAAEQERRLAIQNRLEDSLRRHKVTGRPNRSALEACLTDRPSGKLQIVVLRLNRFHEIEHVVGHQIAEGFVRDYLTSLEEHLRHVGPDTILHIDNAPVVSINTMDAAFVLARAIDRQDPFWQQLVDFAAPDCRYQGYTFNWRCSIGVASLPHHGDSIQEVLSAAGYASLQKEPINFYDNTVHEHQKHQQLLMLDLEDAFRSDQIQLAYQPKVDIGSGRIESVEALVRWYHPEFRMIPPGDWIPLVEELGSITRVTRWVLDRAAADLAQIRAHYGQQTRTAINISSRDLAIPELAEDLERIVRHRGYTPEDFILEITETSVIRNLALTIERLGQLRRCGFGIALDDFGTGTSSLSALTEFPLDEVKIDRSFLTRILWDEERQKVFRATVELAQSLNLRTVIEGVENEQTVQWLRQFKGLKGQGYFWGYPTVLGY